MGACLTKGLSTLQIFICGGTLGNSRTTKRVQKDLTCLYSTSPPPPPLFLLMSCRTSVGLLSGNSLRALTHTFTAAVINDISSTSTENASLESLVVLHGQTLCFQFCIHYKCSRLGCFCLKIRK